jgi:hypothetical protein
MMFLRKHLMFHGEILPLLPFFYHVVILFQHLQLHFEVLGRVLGGEVEIADEILSFGVVKEEVLVALGVVGLEGLLLRGGFCG